MLILVASNKQNQDYQAYLDIFNEPDIYSELGYAILAQGVSLAGGQHQDILIILACFFLVTFLRLQFFSTYLGVSLVLYLIFPFPIDVIQIRNTFAVLFSLNAIISISNRNYYTFTIYAVFAVLFHSFAYVYLATILLAKLKFIKKFLIIIMTFSATSLLLGGFVFSLIGIRTSSSYISEDLKFLSLLIWGGLGLFDLVILKQLKIFEIRLDDKQKKLAETIRFIIISSFAFIGFLLYVYEFNRLYRFVLMLKFIYFSLIFSKLNANQKIIFSTYFISTTLFFGLYYHSQLDFDYVLFGF